MTVITDADLELLRTHAGELGPGRWVFEGDPRNPHSAEEALAIIRACLALDVPVTDRLTSAAWLKLVSKVAALEARVSQLGPYEQPPPGWP